LKLGFYETYVYSLGKYLMAYIFFIGNLHTQPDGSSTHDLTLHLALLRRRRYQLRAHWHIWLPI